MVAIPTETVYGLGGWIHSPGGLEKIFSTKERPFFDPLIVHVSSIENARKLCSEWTEVHQILAQTCWPGPLTLIAPKHPDLNPLITSGLNSVGIRCPDHQLTLKLLGQIEGGIAAPSANKFGKTSPTTSEHVFQEFGDAVSILEGGAASIGIESTVVDIKLTSHGYSIEVYRPGYYTASMLEEILAKNKVTAQVIYSASPVAPGQLKHHYMPKIPLVIVGVDDEWESIRPRIEKALNKSFQRPARWIQSGDAHIASRELYQKLREFDLQGYDIILTAKSDFHHSEEWKGIWDRLEKAQSMS